MSTSAYAEIVARIADLAALCVQRGVPTEDAIDKAADCYVIDVNLARRRRGQYAYETPSEVFEAVEFAAMVARDVLDGDISRPSVGNVRDAVRVRLAEMGN